MVQGVSGVSRRDVSDSKGSPKISQISGYKAYHHDEHDSVSTSRKAQRSDSICQSPWLPRFVHNSLKAEINHSIFGFEVMRRGIVWRRKGVYEVVQGLGDVVAHGGE